MAFGQKTGGRKKGTPNRRTAEVVERLAALDCDPLAGMAALAMDEVNAPELRGRMYAELAQYLYPKRRAIESAPEEKQQVIFQIGIEADPSDTSALKSTNVDKCR
jgi:hypothetical protein